MQHAQTRASTQPPASASLRELAGELLALAADLLSARTRRGVEQGLERIERGAFNLVVLGEFKRGKSTLVNALLGRELLPTGVLPLTAVVTLVRHGSPERLLVSFADGREERHPLDALETFATEAGNPGNERGVEMTVAELESELLAGGVQLADTPGIGSIYLHNTETARAFMPQVDAALLVLAADQPLSEREHELLVEAAAEAPRLLVALNKVDRLRADERREALEFVRGALGGIDAELELFAVSALEGIGVHELAGRLARLTRDEGRDLARRSVRRLCARAAREAAGVARFEARAIETPLDELARRAATFEERIEALAGARDEAGALLEHGAREAIERELGEPLTGLASRERDQLVAGLRALAEEQRDAPPDHLADILEAWVDGRVRELLGELAPELEHRLAHEVEQLERRHVRRIEELLADLGDIAEDVFGARMGRVFADVGLREPPAFSFKLHDPRSGLEQLVGASRRRLPGALGRRLVARDAEQRLLRMVDRHAGRLRAGLAAQVRESVRAFEHDLRGVVDEAIEGIRAAVARARAELGRGEERARARLGRLEGAARRLDRLAAEAER